MIFNQDTIARKLTRIDVDGMLELLLDFGFSDECKELVWVEIVSHWRIPSILAEHGWTTKEFANECHATSSSECSYYYIRNLFAESYR